MNLFERQPSSFAHLEDQIWVLLDFSFAQQCLEADFQLRNPLEVIQEELELWRKLGFHLWLTLSLHFKKVFF